MECRSGCGACCIAPSISGPLPGMPNGKPAGEHCLQLMSDMRCAIFGQRCAPVLKPWRMCVAAQKQRPYG